MPTLIIAVVNAGLTTNSSQMTNSRPSAAGAPGVVVFHNRKMNQDMATGASSTANATSLTRSYESYPLTVMEDTYNSKEAPKVAYNSD